VVEKNRDIRSELLSKIFGEIRIMVALTNTRIEKRRVARLDGSIATMELRVVCDLKFLCKLRRRRGKSFTLKVENSE
jgi:hypothetical protein